MTAPPREPTDKMLFAGTCAWTFKSCNPRAVWQSMYDAAPAPSADRPAPQPTWTVCPRCQNNIARCDCTTMNNPSAAQPAEPCKPCDNVDQFGQECHLHKGHIGNHRRAPAEPPAQAATDAFMYLMNRMDRAAMEDNPAEHGYSKHRAAVFDYVERQALEIAELREMCRVNMERITTCADDRDALRECVRAADAMRAGWMVPTDGTLHRKYDAARAKVQP